MYNGHLVGILGIENTEEGHGGKIESQTEALGRKPVNILRVPSWTKLTQNVLRID